MQHIGEAKAPQEENTHMCMSSYVFPRPTKDTAIVGILFVVSGGNSKEETFTRI